MEILNNKTMYVSRSIFLAAIVSLSLFLNNCNTDKLKTVEFTIRNQHVSDIEVNFIGYKLDGYKIIDTVFFISRNEQKMVYFEEGLRVPENRFFKDELLQICDTVVISSGDVISTRNYMQESEWVYDQKKQSRRYSLTVNSEDF